MKRFLGGVALLLLAGSAIGCSADPRFRLEDVERLSVGTSTRAELNAALGEPESSLDRGASYHTGSSRVQPPFPLSLLSWPVFFHRTYSHYKVTARFDDKGVLTEGSLNVGGGMFTAILILFQPHSFAPTLNREEIDKLRAIDAKGIKVSVTAPDQSLDDYLLGTTEKDINLLAEIDPAQDGIKGTWAWSDGGLQFRRGEGPGLLEIPYVPTEVYSLRLVLEGDPESPSGPFTLGLVAGDRRFAVELGGGPEGDQFGFAGIPSPVRGPALKGRRRCAVVCSVRKTDEIFYTRWSVNVSVEGEQVLDWIGDLSSLPQESMGSLRQPNTLYVGTERNACRFARLTLDCSEGHASKVR